MAVVMNAEVVVKDMKSLLCVVETGGRHSRGSMVVDWKSAVDDPSDAQVREQGRVQIILALHHDIFADMLMKGSQ